MSVELTYDTRDGNRACAREWIPQEEVTALLIINHGMGEHIARYDEFARYLNEEGIAVWGEDHRGHGARITQGDQPGYFATEGGWQKVLDDIDLLVDTVRSRYPDSPLFMLGHSMGSFLTRDYICDHGEKLDGIILTGTGHTPPLLARFMGLVARREIRKFGDRHESLFLNRLTFDNFNNQFKPVRTDCDWLSRDQEKVDLYRADPLCGFVSTSSFYSDLSLGLLRILDKSRLASVPCDLPMFFFSGDRDPLGGNRGSAVRKVVRLYQSLGCRDVSLEFSPGGRHEVFNELDREQTFARMVRFIREKSQK